jgi:2-iminoacetate synthase ThiH
MVKSIREAGRTPVQRNSFYEPIKVLPDSVSGGNPENRASTDEYRENLATA